MTPFRFGEIVLVPFPFTDQSGTKRRPAVVVSSDEYNTEHIDLVVMAVTSQTSGRIRPNEVDIDDWRSAGLLKESRIKPIFTTIENVLVLRSLGNLTKSDSDRLRTEIHAMLG